MKKLDSIENEAENINNVFNTLEEIEEIQEFYNSVKEIIVMINQMYERDLLIIRKSKFKVKLRKILDFIFNKTTYKEIYIYLEKYIDLTLEENEYLINIIEFFNEKEEVNWEELDIIVDILKLLAHNKTLKSYMLKYQLENIRANVTGFIIYNKDNIIESDEKININIQKIRTKLKDL